VVGAGDELENCDVTQENFTELILIYGHVTEGAQSFLTSQYSLCAKFTLAFAGNYHHVFRTRSRVLYSLCDCAIGVVFVLCSRSTALNEDRTAIVHEWHWMTGALTAAAFAVGAFTSIVAGSR